MTSAETPLPDAHLEVAVQQRQNGKIDRALHLLELSCWDGQCSLTTVTLNQCMQSSDGRPAFYPKVQRSSTQEGNLAVENARNTLVVRETDADIGGDYINTLRFEYEPRQKGKAVTRLLGFSGGYVKNSVILKEVLTVDYVPLHKPSQVLALDCSVLLPGVDRN